MEDALEAFRQTMRQAVQDAEVAVSAKQAEFLQVVQRIQQGRQTLANEESALEEERAELERHQEQLRIQQEEVSRLREEVNGRGLFGCCSRPPPPQADRQLDFPPDVTLNDPSVDQIIGSEGQQ
eukprot:CAMPEP_0176236650 /NCGR_PEP_ID=MMETSP0121_2-20121125/27449_1 /TAXON_ID=160619 /ORGANISM="Kryptoperidinium foliaceum, Strain CCMP 1326" /LENGTH=123 /DNA_ID=CAMNT_0017576081 /DNA_START=64 /DNA_END=435 /DNA_ORIENTATION=+